MRMRYDDFINTIMLSYVLKSYAFISNSIFFKEVPLASIWCKACDLFEGSNTIRNDLKKMVKSCYICR